MGLIRLLLAFTVVIAHSNPIFGNKIVGGITSVHAFFIISGFYMALILNEKYVTKDSYKLFITNRLLRLYPVYWVMFVITIIVGLLAYRYSNHHPILLRPYLEDPGSLSIFSWICLGISNLTLIGQDWMMFTHPSYGPSPNRTYSGTKWYGGFSDHLPVYTEMKVK